MLSTETNKQERRRKKTQRSEERQIFAWNHLVVRTLKEKSNLRIISIKKQQTYVSFELLHLCCPFGMLFHFCHMRIPVESPLINVTRVILEQNEVRGKNDLKNEIRLRQLDAPSASSSSPHVRRANTGQVS